MLRFLVAEDDSASRMFLFKLLSQYGECDMVKDGAEAIDAFIMSRKELKPYDLICLDIMMPKIDGVRVLEAIRDIEKKAGILQSRRSRVVLTTALAKGELVKSAYEIGCDAYFQKPIHIHDFLEIVNKIKESEAVI